MSRKTLVNTFFLSFHSSFYFIDDSVALLDCGVVAAVTKRLNAVIRELLEEVISRQRFRLPSNTMP
jgi:hypothetical protein